MKKKLYHIVCLCSFISIVLCACGKQGNPIVLPDREDIISIGVSDGEKYGFSPNTEEEADAFIDEFLAVLMDMHITDKQSVTDVPTDKDYITISLNCDDETTTLFYYIEKDIEYIEQPYQGIYEVASSLGLSRYITEMFASADNTQETITFQATVMEATEDSILIKPKDGSLELDSADRFCIPNKENKELQTGDFIEVTYNGEILESYPAQVGEVYKITLIGRSPTSEAALDTNMEQAMQ